MIRPILPSLGRLLVALALVASSAIVTAQTGDSDTPPVPDPAALTADWWQYFEAAGDERAERAAALQALLDALSESLTQVGERENKQRALIIEISDLIESYLDAHSREPPPPLPTLPTAERYAIEAVLKLASVTRESNLERDLEREDVDRTARLLAASAKRIENAKAAYLALPATAPERLERGLQLMRIRFVQSINDAELKLRRLSLERLTERTERLDAELEHAGKFLSVKSEEASAWTVRAQRAREEQLRLEAEASNARLRASRFGDDARERSRRRRLEQRLVEFAARIVTAQLTALQDDLTAALIGALSAPDSASLGVLRERRTTLDKLLGDIKERLDVWRRATERERAAAMAQLAETGATDAPLAELHRSRVARADETSEQINNLSRLLAQGRTLSRVAETHIIEESGVAADLLHRTQALVEGSWTQLTSWTSGSLFTINETPVTAGGLLRVAIILVAAWWLSRLVRGGLEQLVLRRETMSRAALYTLGRLFHYVILVIAFIIALSSIGIDFTKFALFASALGVGLGFGLQAIFSNFVAGLIILFERSLKVGDFVELESGLTGEVREVNIRATLITTNDNIDILVPNSEFVGGRVTNWTLREAHRRVRIPFGVAYGTDKEGVKKAVLEAAAAVPYTLTTVKGREPQVWLVNFGDSSLDFQLVAWLTQDAVKRPGTVHAAYCWAIETALSKHGIEIPFPQRDLHIRSCFGEKAADGLRALGAIAGKTPSDVVSRP